MKLGILFFWITLKLGFAMPTITILDRISKLISSESGYRVGFQERAGVYHLKKTNSKFKELEKRLAQAQKTNTELTIRVNADSLEILEIVPSL